MRATCIKERAERPSVLLSLAQRLLSSGALVALWHPMQLSGSGLSVRTTSLHWASLIAQLSLLPSLFGTDSTVKHIPIISWSRSTLCKLMKLSRLSGTTGIYNILCCANLWCSTKATVLPMLIQTLNSSRDCRVGKVMPFPWQGACKAAPRMSGFFKGSFIRKQKLHTTLRISKQRTEQP